MSVLAADMVKGFLLAGRARFTLVSAKTGNRFTYQVNTKENGMSFVQVLTGPNNEADYGFLGTIFAGTKYAHGTRSRIGKEAPSAKAFDWASKYLLAGEVPPNCEVHHEGKCARCGRSLTDPESIRTGFGPTCRSY